ncbi:MAG: hypothetical protein V9E87_01485 [Gemmatimonadales bacterium]
MARGLDPHADRARWGEGDVAAQQVRREEQEERDDRQAGEDRQDAADGREQEDVVGDVALEDRIDAAERRPVECQQGRLPGGRATAPEEEAEEERQRKRDAPKDRRQVDRRHVRPELHGEGERMQSPAHDAQSCRRRRPVVRPPTTRKSARRATISLVKITS